MRICLLIINFIKKLGVLLEKRKFTRNALEKGYSDCEPDDLIMISDLDEIPNPENIKEFKSTDKIGCFVRKIFCLS